MQVAQNYGRLQVESLGFVASVSVLGTNVWTAATLGDTLYLSYVAMEPLISRETQRRIVRRTRALLEAAVGTPLAAGGDAVQNHVELG